MADVSLAPLIAELKENNKQNRETTTLMKDLIANLKSGEKEEAKVRRSSAEKQRDDEAAAKEIKDLLGRLQGFEGFSGFTELTERSQEVFKTAIENAEEGRGSLETQLKNLQAAFQTIGDTQPSKEELSEEKASKEKDRKVTGRLAASVDGLKSAWDKIRDAGMKSGGLLGTLGLLAALANPDLLFKAIRFVFDDIRQALDGIAKIMEGDVWGGIKELATSWFGIGAIIFVVVKAVGVIASIITAVSAILPFLSAGFTGMLSGLGAAAAAIAPIAGIAIAGAAIIYGIAVALQTVIDNMSAVSEQVDNLPLLITNFLSSLFGGFIGGIVQGVANVISWIASLFGFEDVAKAIDSVDYVSMFTDGIQSVFDKLTDSIYSVIGWIIDKLNIIPGVDISTDFIKDYEAQKVMRDQALENMRAEKAEQERLEKIEQERIEGNKSRTQDFQMNQGENRDLKNAETMATQQLAIQSSSNQSVSSNNSTINQKTINILDSTSFSAFTGSARAVV